MTDSDIRFMVIELGLPGAIRCAERLAKSNGPLAREYRDVYDYLRAYRAAVNAIS
jgi:hypothetical protein